jgi:FtsH-binding integral membrane protein
MNEKKVRNLRNYFFGYLLIILSGTLMAYFLPFYLKEQGLAILQIGAFLTIGIALGSLLGSLIFGNFLKKMKLRTGLFISGIFTFLYSFIFFIFPSYTGGHFIRVFRKI